MCRNGLGIISIFYFPFFLVSDSGLMYLTLLYSTLLYCVFHIVS